MKSVRDLPGSLGLPYIGEAVELFRDRQLYYWNKYQRYGPVFKTQIIGRKTVVLVGPEANRAVLKDEAHKFSTKVGWSFLSPILGDSLLLRDGEIHQHTRKLTYPAFHGKSITGYLQTIDETIKEALWKWPQQNPVALAKEIDRITLSIACKLFLGARDPDLINELCLYFVDFVEGIATIVRLDTPATAFGRALRARRKIEAYLRSVIHQRRQSRRLGESQDVLGLLLTAAELERSDLSDTDVITLTLQFLFGGYKTTSILLCWAVFELAAKPEWAERLRIEMEQVVGDYPFQVAHLRQLTQLDCFLKEIERLYPPSYFIPRGVVEDFEFAGYAIPAGWHVQVSPLLTHRMPELYNNPNRFDPDRFAPPREEHKKHPYALIGFGAGPHRCIGYELAQMEAKVFVSTLLKHFEWEILLGAPDRTPVLSYTKDAQKLSAYMQFRSLREAEMLGSSLSAQER